MYEFLSSPWGMVLGALLGIASAAGTVAGLRLAYVERTRRRDLQQRTNAEVWVSLRTTMSVLDELEKSPTREQDLHVAVAHGKIIERYRRLLNHAIQDEPRFDETTIMKWRAVGKLQGDWQEAQAKQVLCTEAIQLIPSKENQRKELQP